MNQKPGFTLVEILIVVICIAIAAAMVLPAIGGTGSTELKSAAQMLVADLEFAQTESTMHGDDPRMVVFDMTTNSYMIVAKSDPTVPVLNPVGQEPYSTRYGQGRAAALTRVRIQSHTLGPDNRLGFGVHGQLDRTLPASITLAAGNLSITITIDPATGEASVGEIQ